MATFTVDPTSLNMQFSNGSHGNIYPEDLFSVEDRKHGWMILHIFGIVYILVSLIFVCDQYFVPALEVITEKLSISHDVTGATFMAAGPSILWLIVISVGVFNNGNIVSIGSVTGSAVFHFLFVIGICALLSRKVLHLTRWPLSRDVSFYILYLMLLFCFFLDDVLTWYENMVLVTCYILYIIFLGFNAQAKQAFSIRLLKHRTKKTCAVEECKESDVHEGEVDVRIPVQCAEDAGDSQENGELELREKDGVEESQSKAMSLRWPDTWTKRVAYIIFFPVIFPLWLTIPDVRSQKYKKFFALTYLVSVTWIGIFSYLLIWWAYQVEETLHCRISITILVSALSDTDLITSVIVARKGLGDMAVSSSFGKNIFNITISLPIPLLLYTYVNGLTSGAVSSKGLLCSSVLLFVLLLSAVISILSCRLKMKKVLGFLMLLLYVTFVVIGLMFEYGVIVCPI